MVTSAAPAPQRAHTSFTLSWSLVAIPVSVFTGTESTRVSRKEFIETEAGDIEVGRSPIRKDTGEVIDTADVIRKAQATSGAWVTLTDDEVADATSTVRGQGEIVSFVPVKSVSQYLAEGVAQVRPKATKGKVDPAGAKAFALLLATLKRNKVQALVRVALRGPARYGLLDHEGNLTLILTADAVREARPLDDGFKFSDAELDLASQLITLVGIEAPVLSDTNAPLVQSYVDAKGKGLPVPAAPAAPVMTDIMAALSASIDAAKAKVDA